MKIAAGLVAVLLAMLGMIAAIGQIDGSIEFGEPSAAQPSAVDGTPVTGIEKAFLEFVVNALQSVSTDINTLGHLFMQPEMEDQYWQASVTVLLNRIEAGYASIAPLQPTERLRPFHDSAVKALDHSAEFAAILRANLIEGQTDLTEEAAIELMAAAEAFDQSEAVLNEFLDAHPLPQ